MDKRNDRFRDFHGVTAWHKAGYTGRRGLSASGEEFAKDPYGHPGMTRDAFKEIAPDRDLIFIDWSGKVPANYEYVAETIAEKGVDSVFMSFIIEGYTADRYDHIFEPVKGFCSLYNSIGNDAGERFSAATRSAYIHGVGAIIVDSFGNIERAGYSSIAEEIDFMAVTDLYIQRTMFDGTSCSAPVLCGMAALVNDFFIDKTGKPLTNEAMYRFFKDNTVDMERDGHDSYTGWGYVVLPPPETVDIEKYATVEEPEPTPEPTPVPEPTPEEPKPPVYSKTSSGLIEYAKAQLGKPYWYGTFGQIATADLYATKKAQYPSYYTASDFVSQYGKKVHDCIGLIKGYLFSDTPASVPRYNAQYDKTADMFYSLANSKGAIATMPKVPGVLVHSPDHIGVYIGNGEVIEAKGHAYGVVKTKLSDGAWDRWSKCPYIVYDTAEEKTESADEPKDRYNTLAEIPDWAQPTIKKLISLGALKGDDSGLDLSYDMIRMFVINDRMGVYK